MKRTALFGILFLFALISHAQVNPTPAKNDSCTLEISLLTCAPGTDLYSLFGHTAIRVRDIRRGMDVVYNYGTFDDTDPMFYLKFMRGIMRYSLSAETYDSFMQEYIFEHRAVIAQVLDMTCIEKNNLYEALRKNTLDENRLYDYHFHTDNCTTRAGRIIESNVMDTLIYKNILPVNSAPLTSTLMSPNLTFRDMIHEYLDKQQVSWSEFGIDLFLGSNLDKKVTNIEAIHFLPDYLLKGMDSAFSGKRQIVSAKQKLLDFPVPKHISAGLTPMALFECLLLGLILLFIFRGSPGITKTILIFDIVFFSLLGLLGILMALMWLGRVDNVCSKNINILWAVPTHIVAVFFIRKKYSWVKYYFLLTAIMALVLGIGFPWWPQRMNSAVLPILGIIIFRGVHLFQIRQHAEKPAIQG
jgi:Domain of unknown function (DUF4105)